MALLIDVGHGGWMTNAKVRDQVLAHDPGADVRLNEAPGDLTQIRMLAVSRLSPDLPAMLPNLQLVQKLGAGVETIVAHPKLPDHVRVTRLKPDAPAQEIAEYFLTYVLRDQRQLRFYDSEQAARRWSPLEPRVTQDTVVAVLGLGHIGGRTAALLRDVGFQVIGWSRSAKTLRGVDCKNGRAALPDVLALADYVCAVLPSTPNTRGMFDAALLAAMKPGSVLMNAGRGDLVDEDALLAALTTGPISGAVLDVTHDEPLPATSALWAHPGVSITPHVSGWHLGDAFGDIAENLRRLLMDAPLLHEVDRIQGY